MKKLLPTTLLILITLCIGYFQSHRKVAIFPTIEPAQSIREGSTTLFTDRIQNQSGIFKITLMKQFQRRITEPTQ